MSRIESTTVGEVEIIALTDGEVEFGKEVFPAVDPARIDEVLKATGQDAIRTNFNAFLVRTGDAVVLVDSGPRDLFGPTCGKLPEALAEAGVSPEQVTHIYLTHLHPDHIAGTITPEGEAVFANAQVFVLEKDHAFWSNETFSDETLQQWQVLAKAVLGAYGGRVEQVSGEAEIAPGFYAMPLPGHTPGHAGFRIDSGPGFVHVGDISHAQHLQYTDPTIYTAFDVDPETALATRTRTMDMVATDRLLFSGGHALAPKFGYLERAGSGYRFEAA